MDDLTSGHQNPDTDLSLVATDELVEELVRRHDNMLFVGIKDLNKTQEETNIRWRGGVSGALGLCEYAAFRVREDWKQRNRRSGEED